MPTGNFRHSDSLTLGRKKAVPEEGKQCPEKGKCPDSECHLLPRLGLLQPAICLPLAFMWKQGPYIALHLRLEKDVWVRTGCLPGLSSEYDAIVQQKRKNRPSLLTARSNLTYHERKLEGLCPLNALEVARLLKALGAPSNVHIYWAGGEPLGGIKALEPLTKEFPNFYNKRSLALPGELDSFSKKESVLAAIDYIVSPNSDVFTPSHEGNMGKAIQGHRAHEGHRKHITPNKRKMLPYFLDKTLTEQDFNTIIQREWGCRLYFGVSSGLQCLISSILSLNSRHIVCTRGLCSSADLMAFYRGGN